MADLTIKLDENTYTQVYAKMIALSNFEKEGIISYGLRQGANIIARQGKANLVARNKAKTGKLLKSISVSVNKKKVKSYGGFKRPGGNVAHLIDMGTDERYTRKGLYRGSISKGKPNTGSNFWTDAFAAKKDAAANTMIKTINKCINMIMNR